MKKLIFLLSLVYGVAVAQVGPPPATSVEVAAGIDRYKYLTPFSAAQGMGGPTQFNTTNSLSSTWWLTNGGMLYATGFTNAGINGTWTLYDAENLLATNAAGYYWDIQDALYVTGPDTTQYAKEDLYDFMGQMKFPGTTDNISGTFRYATNTVANSYTPSKLGIPYNYFKEAVRNVALSNQGSATLAGVAGVPVYAAGNKTGYTSEYLRDFVLAMQATNLCTHTQLWLRAYTYSRNTYTNAVPDIVGNTNASSGSAFVGPGNSVDSAYYYTFLVHLGYEQAVREGLGNPTKIFTNFITTITNTIQSGITHSNGLVWMSGDRVGWGFHDNLYHVKTGLVAMESLLEAAAYGKIAQMAFADGTATYTNVGNWAAVKLNTVSVSIVTNLFDWDVGLFRACSTKTNFDVIASAFAVHADVVPPLVKQRISKAFIDGYYGGATFNAGRGFWQRGRLSHCRRGEYWQNDTYLGRVEGGKHYQFGGYWAFGGWGADALAVYRPDLAERAMADFYEGLKNDAENWEWTNTEYGTPLAFAISSQIYLMTPGAGLHYRRKEFVLP